MPKETDLLTTCNPPLHVGQQNPDFAVRRKQRSAALGYDYGAMYTEVHQYKTLFLVSGTCC